MAVHSSHARNTAVPTVPGSFGRCSVTAPHCGSTAATGGSKAGASRDQGSNSRAGACCAQLVTTPVLPDRSMCVDVPRCDVPRHGTGSPACLVGICYLHKLQVQLLHGIQHPLQRGPIDSPPQCLHGAACRLSSAAVLSMCPLAAASRNPLLGAETAAGNTRGSRCGRPNSCRAGCIL